MSARSPLRHAFWLLVLGLGLVGCARSHGRHRLGQDASAEDADARLEPVDVDEEDARARADASNEQGSDAALLDGALTDARPPDACVGCVADGAGDDAADAELVACPGPGCPCDDGNPCTDDVPVSAPMAGEPPCRHTPRVCEGDGFACTRDVCDPVTGCRYRPEAVRCDSAANPCLIARCDANAGCSAAPLADGTPCGWESCARAQRCSAGECVIMGSLDLRCEPWFTPGTSAILPWGVRACGSATGRALDVVESYTDDGTYELSLTSELRGLQSGELMYSQSGRFWHAQLWDGSRWSRLNLSIPEPYPPEGWRVLDALDASELVLLRQTKQACVQALRMDRATGAVRPWSASMFSADPCAATGMVGGSTRRVVLGTDGDLWTFSFEEKGLLRFEDGAWRKQPFADLAGDAEPELLFDREGLRWVTGTRDHVVWYRATDGFRPAAVPALLVAPAAVHLTPRGTLLLSTGGSVVELTGTDVITYPAPPVEGMYEVSEVVSDADGLPVVGTGWNGSMRHRFENGAWRSLEWAERLGVDAQLRIYRASFGQVERLEGERWLPVGPQRAHGSPDTQLVAQAVDLSLRAGLRLSLLSEGTQGRVNIQQSELAADAWVPQQLALPADQGSCSEAYGRDASLHAYRAGSLVVCPDQWIKLVRGDSTVDLKFLPGLSPRAQIDDAFASAERADGSLVVAYVVADPGRLDGQVHVAELGADGLVHDDQQVPDGVISNLQYIVDDRLQLVALADGLAVFWRSIGPTGTSSEISQRAQLFSGGGWRALAPPKGKPFADLQGRLWLARELPEGVLLSRWSGSSWEDVASGPLRGARPDLLAFDGEGNPMLAVATGPGAEQGQPLGSDGGLGLMRYKGQRWSALNDSMRAGGLNNSCSRMYYPRLASDGERVCMSWLEVTDMPFTPIVRCTQLTD